MAADGRTVVVNAREGTSSSLLMQYLDKFDAMAIPSTSGSSMPFVSTDGMVVGFAAIDGSLMSISSSGDASGSLATVQVHCKGAMFGPAGRLIVGRYDGGLFERTAAGTWAALTLRADTERGHTWPHLLPDGDEIVFTIEYPPPRPSMIAVARLSRPGSYTAVTRGRRAWFVNARHLVVAREDGLWVVERTPAGAAGRESKIDADVAHAADGTPIAAVGGGHLVYVTPPSGDALIGGRANGKGPLQYVLSARGSFSQPRLSPDGLSVAVNEDADSQYPSLAVYDVVTGTRIARTTITSLVPPRWTDDSRWVLFPQATEGGWRLSWLSRIPSEGVGSVLTLTESRSRANRRGAAAERLRTAGISAEWLITNAASGVCVNVAEPAGTRLRSSSSVLAAGLVDRPCGNPNYDISRDGSSMVAVYRDPVSRPSSLRFVLNFDAELR
jgi:hypothetical protein